MGVELGGGRTSWRRRRCCYSYCARTCRRWRARGRFPRARGRRRAACGEAVPLPTAHARAAAAAARAALDALRSPDGAHHCWSAACLPLRLGARARGRGPGRATRRARAHARAPAPCQRRSADPSPERALERGRRRCSHRCCAGRARPVVPRPPSLGLARVWRRRARRRRRHRARRLRARRCAIGSVGAAGRKASASAPG